MTPDPTSLDRLHDIVAAPAMPWWPPAVGWYWLFGLLFLLLIVFLLRSLLLWQHNRTVVRRWQNSQRMNRP
jgi:hypothetical protein